ncbi:cell division control protein 1 [Thrips palmi]|uniref:Cell division control protein 1 n=1 Tax=Thrips palmi TaxID=161013 RepID=A0A6P8ZZ49_THRPL|nr:cell division control protein 1 [Thrips palmi]
MNRTAYTLIGPSLRTSMAWKAKNGKWRRTSILILVLLSIFYLEFLIYFVQAWTWQSLHCPTNSKCTRFLFVADPQILGELDEPNSITIWDNDRYLHRTFLLALSHIQPDAVVFLGDLMDEGNRANDFEFQRYVDRFFNIFPLENVPQSLFLPGDNDIGGENGDPILPSVVYRFRHIFHKTKELIVNLCLILKVNPVLEPMPRPDPSHVTSEKFIRIGVSHFPLLGMSTPFTEKVLKDFKPHVIFSAHSHLSRLRGPTMKNPSPLNDMIGPVQLGQVNQTKDKDYEDGWSDGSFNTVQEIEVPTCSYRMGVYNMGYGYALFDETRKELQYAVLWLPNRLIHLKLYLYMSSCFGLVFLFWFICAYGRAHRS